MHGKSSLITRLATALVSGALLVLPTQAAAQHAIYGPGLPMWVVRDADSTIYITGTVHLLRDEHVWSSAKLEAAFAAASELWLELEEIGNPDALEEQVEVLLREAGAMDGEPIRDHLDAVELATYAGLLEQAGVPAEIVESAGDMQPWMAIDALGRGFFLGGGYKPEHGIDNALSRMAIAAGKPIRGMEKLEVQIALVLDASEEDQVEALRTLIKAPPSYRNQMARIADIAFGSWVRGEIHGAEALMMFQAIGAAATGGNTDALLKDRNVAWAGVVEDMLEGAGVSFIAVGAAHLVGADSLQQQLKLRGIKSERY